MHYLRTNNNPTPVCRPGNKGPRHLPKPASLHPTISPDSSPCTHSIMSPLLSHQSIYSYTWVWHLSTFSVPTAFSSQFVHFSVPSETRAWLSSSSPSLSFSSQHLSFVKQMILVTSPMAHSCSRLSMKVCLSSLSSLPGDSADPNRTQHSFLSPQLCVSHQ